MFGAYAAGLPNVMVLLPGGTYLVAWRRTPRDGSGRHANPAVITLPVRHLGGVAATPEVLYPGDAQAEVRWEPAAGALAVVLPRTPSACLIQLHANP